MKKIMTPALYTLLGGNYLALITKMESTMTDRKNSYKTFTARAPDQTIAYMKCELVDRLKTGSLDKMFEMMLTKWFTDRPWERQFPWKETMGPSYQVNLEEAITRGDWSALKDGQVARTAASGWAQINMRISSDLAAKVISLASKQGVSKWTVLYTCIVWWTWFVNPPEEVKERRRIEREAKLEQWWKDRNK